MTPFSAAVRSEWTKLTALRSTTVAVVVAVLLAFGLTALIALVAGATYSDWGRGDRESFEPITTALVGGIPSAIIFLALAARAATSEYATGTIRLTLAATPRRGRVIAAKALVVAAITLAAGAVLTAGTVLLAQAIFASYGMPHAGAGDGDLLRAVIAGALLSPQFPLIALALGVVLRSTAAAVIGVFAVLFAPAFLGAIVPASWTDVLDWLPGPAGDAVSIGHLDASAHVFSPIVGALLVIAWTALFLGAAWAALEARDA